MTLLELARRWREDAQLLERYGATQLAQTCRTHADELDTALRSQTDDNLDLTAAARESGYSADRLRHMLAEGRLPNAGHKGAPRIRRGDLPIKAKRPDTAFDATRAARAALR